MTSEEIVAAYKAKNPRASTNRAVVAELAVKSGKTVAQVRGILIFNHVYMSIPDHERFAPDGTELKTVFAEEENAKVWDEYLRTNPKSNDEKSRAIDDISLRLKATPYSVKRVIELAARPLTENEREEEDNKANLLNLEIQEQANAKKSAIIRNAMIIAFIAIAITALVFLLNFQNNAPSTGHSSEVETVTSYDGSSEDASDNTSVTNSRPITGMDAENKRRYDNFSPEAKDYVQEKMKKYDEVCAKYNNC